MAESLEFWVRGTLAANTAAAIACGATYSWITGNILIDRDRYNQPRAFGLSFGAGRAAFGVVTDQGARTLCGTTVVLDGAWHHVAVQRRRADGRLWLFVDGGLQAESVGPAGDLSYPDDGVPGPYCGGPCLNSDPFLVLGAEKHDAGPAYPAFNGWLDELRLSRVLRYSGPFTRPAAPFVSDAVTSALYHFDEGAGDLVGDSAGAVGGPSPGVRRYGGATPGPQWVTSDVPFRPTAPAGPALAVTLNAAAFRPGETMIATVRAVAGRVVGLVDAYAVVQLPGGALLSLQLDGRLVPGLVPLARAVGLPDAAVAFTFPIPAGTSPGAYLWRTAAAVPGTLALVTAIADTPFQILP